MEDVESNTSFSLKIGVITTYLYAEGSDHMKETFLRERTQLPEGCPGTDK